MSDPVQVYDAANGAEAALIRAELAEHDIEAFIDTTPSPLDGLTFMGQGTPVFVRSEDAEKARRIVNHIEPERIEEARQEGEGESEESA